MTLLVLCAAALLGLLAGELAPLAPPPGLAPLAPPNRLPLLLLAAAAALGALLVHARPRWRLLACACCAAALGALRSGTHTTQDPDPLANFNGLEVQLHGEVSTIPLRTDRALRFVLTTTAIDATAVHTRVLIVADPAGQDPLPSLGDAITAHGRLRPNAGVPPRALIYPEISVLTQDTPGPLALGARLRDIGVQGIQRGLPEPQASLAAGVLLGGSGRLSPEFRLQLQRSGLAHIVAIDGYKQVLVSAVIGAVAVRVLGRMRAAAPIVLGIVGYTLLTGARPSAVRAGLMVGMATTASVLGRVADPLTGCLVAAAIMAGWDPDVLRDVGFQLSFSATLGLILLWPRLRRFARAAPPFIAEPAGITLAVTIATLPVMLCVFQSVSLISPLAHVVAMPLLPPVLISAAVLASTASWPPANQVVGWLAWLPTTALAETVRISGSLPAAALSTGRLPVAAGVVLGLGLLAWGLWELPELAEVRSWLSTLTRRNSRTLVPCAMAGLSLVGLGTLLLVRPDGRLHAYVLDVAPGQAVLIRGPTGHIALVASGRIDSYSLPGAVAERLAVWEHGLGAVVALDAEAEARLAPTLEHFPAEQVLGPGVDQRVDLDCGAALDSYPGRGASVSYGGAWLRLLGQPPAPRADTSITLVDLVQDVELEPRAVRSDPTTSAARPAKPGQS